MIPVLSVCIPTLSNPDGVKATLERLITEATNTNFIDQIEFCIADNSEDELTDKVVFIIKSSNDVRVNYKRHGKNVGYDRNVDSVIKLATGEYCWLLSDNENIKPNCFAEIFNETKDSTTALLIICPETTPDKNLKTYNNFEESIRENSWWIPGGLVSRNIIKRSLIPNDLSSFFGNYWLHLSITTLVAGNRPVKFISEKFIDDRSGLVRWAKNGTTFLTYTSLLNIIKNLPEPPYSRGFKNILTQKMLHGLPHNILSSKLYGLSLSRDNLRLLYQITKKDPVFFVLSFIAMMIPAVVIKYAKRIKQGFSN